MTSQNSSTGSSGNDRHWCILQLSFTKDRAVLWCVEHMAHQQYTIESEYTLLIRSRRTPLAITLNTQVAPTVTSPCIFPCPDMLVPKVYQEKYEISRPSHLVRKPQSMQWKCPKIPWWTRPRSPMPSRREDVFMKAVLLLMKVLDEMAKIHPFISGDEARGIPH